MQQTRCAPTAAVFVLLATATVLQFAFATVDGAAPENANPEPTPEVSGRLLLLNCSSTQSTQAAITDLVLLATCDC